MGKYADLLFDADETLFDFAACEERAFFSSAKSMNIAVDGAAYRMYSEINDALWKAHERQEITREDILRLRYTRLLEAMGLDRAPGVEWNRRYEIALSQTAILFPDTKAVCTRLAQKFRLSVITNGLSHVQRGRMALSGIADLFGDRLFISGEIGYPKPDLRFFEGVSSRLPDMDRTRALVIGDSPTGDLEGARRAGIDAILIDRRELHPGGDVRAIARICNLEELELWLDRN